MRAKRIAFRMRTIIVVHPLNGTERPRFRAAPTIPGEDARRGWSGSERDEEGHAFRLRGVGGARNRGGRASSGRTGLPQEPRPHARPARAPLHEKARGEERAGQSERTHIAAGEGVLLVAACARAQVEAAHLGRDGGAVGLAHRAHQQGFATGQRPSDDLLLGEVAVTSPRARSHWYMIPPASFMNTGMKCTVELNTNAQLIRTCADLHRRAEMSLLPILATEGEKANQQATRRSTMRIWLLAGSTPCRCSPTAGARAPRRQAR